MNKQLESTHLKSLIFGDPASDSGIFKSVQFENDNSLAGRMIAADSGEAGHESSASESGGHEAEVSDEAAVKGADHAAHAEGSDHGAHEAKFELPLEFPNIYTLTTALLSKDEGHGHEEGHHAPFWVDPAFAIFYCTVFVVIIRRILRKTSLDNPSRAQVAVEGIFGGLMDFFRDVLGPQAVKKYGPFVGTLWLFVFLNTATGLIPLFKSTTAHIQVTGALALCTFFYVNYQGIKAGGLKHYLWHMCGSPTDTIGWVFAGIIFPLELMGTFVKPISLALRLFGNIFGEDKLLAAFMGLGMMIVSVIFGGTPTPMFGLPLHFPFLFLGSLTSVIQATVFSTLAAVYITLLLPHDDHHGHGEAGHDHGAPEGAHGHSAH